MMHWQAFPEMARQFIASNSFETLVAGAFGAFFGAWGAQAIITRNRDQAGSYYRRRFKSEVQQGSIDGMAE